MRVHSLSSSCTTVRAKPCCLVKHAGLSGFWFARALLLKVNIVPGLLSFLVKQCIHGFDPCQFTLIVIKLLDRLDDLASDLSSSTVRVLVRMLDAFEEKLCVSSWPGAKRSGTLWSYPSIPKFKNRGKVLCDGLLTNLSLLRISRSSFILVVVEHWDDQLVPFFDWIGFLESCEDFLGRWAEQNRLFIDLVLAIAFFFLSCIGLQFVG